MEQQGAVETLAPEAELLEQDLGSERLAAGTVNSLVVSAEAAAVVVQGPEWSFEELGWLALVAVMRVLIAAALVIQWAVQRGLVHHQLRAQVVLSSELEPGAELEVLQAQTVRELVPRMLLRRRVLALGLCQLDSLESVALVAVRCRPGDESLKSLDGLLRGRHLPMPRLVSVTPVRRVSPAR